MSDQNSIKRIVTFRLGLSNTLPACIKRRNSSNRHQPEKGRQMIRTTSETSLRSLPGQLAEFGEHLSNAWYQVVNEYTSDKKSRGYLLVSFVFTISDTAEVTERQIELVDAVNLFIDLCQQNFWRVETYWNQDNNTTAISCYGRVPTHQADGTPIKVWNRLPSGEKDLEAGAKEMTPNNALSLDALGFVQVESKYDKK